jgi:hypothetical protein
MKIRNEYDCKEEKSRTLSITALAGNMGTGAVVNTGSAVGAWVDLSPDSLGKTQWEIACGKH